MSSKNFIFFLCMYKMVVEISKNKWESCGTKAINYYIEEKIVTELWLKMSYFGTETGLLNIDNAALKWIRKYDKKTKNITIEENEKYKAFFEGEEGAFIIEKLVRDIIERCKLPKAIEFIKKLGYNHDNIMVRKETSIAEKIKLFPDQNTVQNKKFNGRKPDISYKDLHFIVEVDEGSHKNYNTWWKRKRRHV